jgi:hypothetical protein
MDIKQMLMEGQPGCSDQHVENDIDGDGDMNELMRELTDSLAKNNDADLNGKAEPINELEHIFDSQDGPEEFGEPLSEKVAAFFGKIPNQTLTKENMQRLREMYKVPINSKILGVPKVNPEIWSNLPHAIKQSDARYQFQQQYISRAIVAQAEIADRLIKAGNTVPKEISEYLLKATMDSATMIGVAQRELNAKRKAGIKSSVLPEYAAICSNRMQVKEYLFGDDLEQSLKSTKSSSRIVKASPTFVGRVNRFMPYARGSQSSGPLNFRRPFQPRRGNGTPIYQSLGFGSPRFQRPRHPV